ncbi:MAG: HisA/HisF-related TIM barrel protein [Mycetocola sp.]
MSVPPRVIPVLQILDGYLVKTTKFAKPTYIGDPINAVKIFNDKQVDELILCDIGAVKTGTAPDLDLIESIASEAFMPVGYAGGIRSVDDARNVVQLGIEKVVLNTMLHTEPDIVRGIVDLLGGQSVVGSVDTRKNILGKRLAYVDSGTRSTDMAPVPFAEMAVGLGIGEVLLTSIDREGTRAGYDLDLIGEVASAVDVPLIALGGASENSDFAKAVSAGASAVAAGSRFVFHGKHNAVLITYPSPAVIRSLGDELR